MTRKVILTVLTLAALGTPILAWTAGRTSSPVRWGSTECPVHVACGNGIVSIGTSLAWGSRIYLAVRSYPFHEVTFYGTGRVDKGRALPEISHNFGGFRVQLNSQAYVERGYVDTGNLTLEEDYIPTSTQRFHLYLYAPLWALITVLGVYPTVAFIRGPVRRWRRRKKGACLKCAYDLTGNVTGVCPECGTATSQTTKGNV